MPGKTDNRTAEEKTLTEYNKMLLRILTKRFGPERAAKIVMLYRHIEELCSSVKPKYSA